MPVTVAPLSRICSGAAINSWPTFCSSVMLFIRTSMGSGATVVSGGSVVSSVTVVVSVIIVVSDCAVVLGMVVAVVATGVAEQPVSRSSANRNGISFLMPG